MKVLPLFFAPCLFVSTASAQVIEWRAVKGPGYIQNADNAPGPATLWTGDFVVFTTNAGDIGSLTMTGGGIVGSLPYVYEDGAWWLEADFVSQAALNATFPSSTTYTIHASGGTLGSVTQTFSFGAEAYPNVPFLTGTSWTDAKSVDPMVANTLTWSAPGPLTGASGVTILSIYDAADEDVLFQLTNGEAVSGTIDECFLDGNVDLVGFIEYTHAYLQPAEGFSTIGVASHNVGLDFDIKTIPTPLPQEIVRLGVPANPNAFLPGLSGGPTMGEVWEPGIDHTTFALGATLDILAVSFAAPINVPLGPVTGTLVVNITNPNLVFFSPAGVPFALPVPDICALVGLGVTSQGASVVGSDILLANGLDLVVGFP